MRRHPLSATGGRFAEFSPGLRFYSIQHRICFRQLPLILEPARRFFETTRRKEETEGLARPKRKRAANPIDAIGIAKPRHIRSHWDSHQANSHDPALISPALLRRKDLAYVRDAHNGHGRKPHACKQPRDKQTRGTAYKRIQK